MTAALEGLMARRAFLCARIEQIKNVLKEA